MISEQSQKIGFVGLGAMGFPMAKRLASAISTEGKLFVFDIIPQNVKILCQTFPSVVIACNNAREVAEKADVILTMVPEGAHVRSVYLDSDDGILAADVGGKILIDCSTIDTRTSNLVGNKIDSRNDSTSFYDAPVSGGTTGAEKGTLTFMLGCSDDDKNLDYLNILLAQMGKHIFPCGGRSLGLTTKLCNNYLSGLIAIASSEAMNIGMRSGLDPRRLSSIFGTSTAQNCILDKFNPVPGVDPNAPSSHGYEGGFKIQLMRKDFALAVEAAELVGAQLALGTSGLEVYTNASKDEACKDRDSRVVYRYLGGIEDWESRQKSQ